jgi:hypothetical protein
MESLFVAWINRDLWTFDLFSHNKSGTANKTHQYVFQLVNQWNQLLILPYTNDDKLLKLFRRCVGISKLGIGIERWFQQFYILNPQLKVSTKMELVIRYWPIYLLYNAEPVLYGQVVKSPPGTPENKARRSQRRFPETMPLLNVDQKHNSGAVADAAAAAGAGAGAEAKSVHSTYYYDQNRVVTSQVFKSILDYQTCMIKHVVEEFEFLEIMKYLYD